MNADYIELVHRKAVWEWVRDVLTENLVQSKHILCKDAPYVQRNVPMEVVHSIIETVDDLVKSLEDEGSSFSMEKRDGRAEPRSEKPVSKRMATKRSSKGSRKPGQRARKASRR